jgi:ethanolamine utilization microcompartment shell protein EutL
MRDKCILITKNVKIMNKKMFVLVSGIVGALQTAGVAIVTYTSPEYATAINSAIVILGTAIIEACSMFVENEQE